MKDIHKWEWKWGRLGPTRIVPSVAFLVYRQFQVVHRFMWSSVVSIGSDTQVWWGENLRVKQVSPFLSFFLSSFCIYLSNQYHAQKSRITLLTFFSFFLMYPKEKIPTKSLQFPVLFHGNEIWFNSFEIHRLWDVLYKQYGIFWDSRHPFHLYNTILIYWRSSMYELMFWYFRERMPFCRNFLCWTVTNGFWVSFFLSFLPSLLSPSLFSSCILPAFLTSIYLSLFLISLFPLFLPLWDDRYQYILRLSMF